MRESGQGVVQPFELLGIPNQVGKSASLVMSIKNKIQLLIWQIVLLHLSSRNLFLSSLEDLNSRPTGRRSIRRVREEKKRCTVVWGPKGFPGQLGNSLGQIKVGQQRTTSMWILGRAIGIDG